MAFYKIAGLTVRMDTFGRTERQARPYLVPGAPEPQIVVSRDLAAVHAKMPHLSRDDCEYLATGDSFYRQLLPHRGMMLHASAVVMDGRAYAFSAPCGVGKSTHTALWVQTFGADRAAILNDDKPALRWVDGQMLACGTPWSGKDDLSKNECVPLAGVCFLNRGQSNRIRPLSGRQAVYSLLEETVRPSDPALAAQLLSLLDRLLTHVPVWTMQCNMEPDAATLAYEVMSGQKEI